MTDLNSKWVIAVASKNLPLWWAVTFSFLTLASTLRAAAPEPATALAEVKGGASIRTSLASVSASAFAPGTEPTMDLAAITTPRAPSLNVPAPGALSPAKPAVDHIPEPGTIGFGLAITALLAGNFAKSFMRCWKITGGMPERDR